MKKFIRIIKILLGALLALIVLNFLIMRMSPSGFLFVVIALVIVCSFVWFLFRGLFKISEKLGYEKNIYKKIIVSGMILLFVAFTWVPWWQYMFLSVDSLSQKDKLNIAPIYWRFFFTDRSQDNVFLWRILNRRFGEEKKVQELISYLKKSGFICRDYNRTPWNTSAGTSCENRHMAIIFQSVWRVNISHDGYFISKIFVRQDLDAI